MSKNSKFSNKFEYFEGNHYRSESITAQKVELHFHDTKPAQIGDLKIQYRRKEKGRLFHRCKKGGIWHQPENVAVSCEPNGKESLVRTTKIIIE